MAPAEPTATARKRLLDALTAIDEAAGANARRSRDVQRRARRYRQRLLAGERLADLVEREERPRTVELITANMSALESAGAELRAAQALALREEGMTIAAIAVLFGVTRQRISALLRQKAATEVRGLEAERTTPVPVSGRPSPRSTRS